MFTQAYGPLSIAYVPRSCASEMTKATRPRTLLLAVNDSPETAIALSGPKPPRHPYPPADVVGNTAHTTGLVDFLEKGDTIYVVHAVELIIRLICLSFFLALEYCTRAAHSDAHTCAHHVLVGPVVSPEMVEATNHAFIVKASLSKQFTCNLVSDGTNVLLPGQRAGPQRRSVAHGTGP
jgi:hypothetical protein